MICSSGFTVREFPWAQPQPPARCLWLLAHQEAEPRRREGGCGPRRLTCSLPGYCQEIRFALSYMQTSRGFG